MSGKHARLAASSAHRWLRCAGSVGDGKSSEYAAQGTLAHDIAAKCLRDQSIKPADFLLHSEVIDGFKVSCDLDMVESVQTYIDACDEDLQAGDITWVEVPLVEELSKVDPDLGGTADYIRYRPATKSLRVFDFKHGSGVYVEVIDNEQEKVYGVGALLTVLRAGHTVDDIELTICQPRFSGAEPVRSFKFKAVELLDFVADVKEAAERSRQPKPALVAGEHCKFCPNSRTCPELEKRQHALVAADFGPVAKYDVVALATALDQVALVKERIRAIEEFAYAEANRGIEIPGWKLVDKIAHRQWKSEAEVVKWAEAQAIDPYKPREVLSPAQLEEKVKEGAPRGKKKAAVAVLEPFYQRVSSGTALVPASNSRPSVKTIAAADFPALEAK